MLAWTQRCLWCRYGNQLITLVLKFFLSFVVNVIFQTAVIFSSSPLVYSLFQSRFSALTGRSSARSLDRLFVSSFFSRSSIVNSFVRLFVRSLVRSSFFRRSSIVNSFVRQFVPSFVHRSSIVSSFVRLCSFVRSFGPSPVYLVSQSVCLSATQSVSRPDS